jgi:hypothetical protein
MLLQTGHPVLVVRWVARQNPILANDPAIDLAIPHFAPELGFVRRAVLTENLICSPVIGATTAAIGLARSPYL